MSIWLVAYNDWVYKGCFDVINVNVNRLWMILGLTHSAINRLHCHILPKLMYRSSLLRKMKMRRALPHPKNEHQQNINDFWHSVMKHPVGGVVTVHHDRTIGPLSMEQWWWPHIYYVLKMSVNRASTTFGLASWKMHELCGDVTP